MVVANFFAFLTLLSPDILQVESSLQVQQFFENFAFVPTLLGEFLSLMVRLFDFV